MNLQRTALFLTFAVGATIQLLCFSGVVAAAEEPGVPVESVSGNPVTPGDELQADNAIPVSDDRDSGCSAPIADGSAQSDLGVMPGTLYSTPLTGSVERKSIDSIPPNMTPPGVMSPVLPYLTPGEKFAEQRPNPLLQDAQQPTTAEPERESKGSFLGKLSKSLLLGGTNKNVPAAERPWWIPGHAFTDDSMVAPYHNLDIAWWDKRPMPNRPQWVRLSRSVTRYWRGSVSEPCMVLVAPLQQVPGNFTFRSRSFGGPRGWLQALNVPDKKGFPQYRYWLDQP